MICAHRRALPIPSLHPYTLPLCLGILVAITAVNLRGTKESGLALAVPT